MKILTLNTWQESGPWQDRWEVIFKGLESYDPDLVCFQEVFNRSWAEEMKKRAGFPYMFFPQEPSGLLLLSQFPILKKECLAMKTQSPTEEYKRYALFAEIEAGKKPAAVFNTHLSWKLDEGKIRQKQVLEIIQFIDENTNGHETLVTGDFNAPPETPEIEWMRTQGKFQDSYAVLHEDQGFQGLTWDNENPFACQASVRLPGRRIDYIFFRDGAEILGKLSSVEVVFTEPDNRGIYASDHYGVLAAFTSVAETKKRGEKGNQ